jgi:hypothetical protein
MSIGIVVPSWVYFDDACSLKIIQDDRFLGIEYSCAEPYSNRSSNNTKNEWCFGPLQKEIRVQ